MALSEIQQAEVNKRLGAFCEARIPPAVRNKVRYVGTQRLWRLYCQHRDLRWHSYEARPAAPSFKRLLDEVAADPTGIFWG